jgi:hypothetical protein
MLQLLLHIFKRLLCCPITTLGLLALSLLSSLLLLLVFRCPTELSALSMPSCAFEPQLQPHMESLRHLPPTALQLVTSNTPSRTVSLTTAERNFFYSYGVKKVHNTHGTRHNITPIWATRLD